MEQFQAILSIQQMLKLIISALKKKILTYLVKIQDLEPSELTISCFNSHHTREFTPHHTSWFSTTKGLDFEGVARDRVNLIT